MEAYVLKLKKLSSFSLAHLLILLLALTVVSPLKLAAQDDVPVSDDEIIIPPGSSSGETPPVIIDESDAGSVSDVEEYDG